MKIDKYQAETMLQWLATIVGERGAFYEDCKMGLELMKNFSELDYEGSWLEKDCKEIFQKQEEKWYALGQRFDLSKTQFACDKCKNHLSEKAEEYHDDCPWLVLVPIENSFWAKELRGFLVLKNKIKILQETA